MCSSEWQLVRLILLNLSSHHIFQQSNLLLNMSPDIECSVGVAVF